MKLHYYCPMLTVPQYLSVMKKNLSGKDGAQDSLDGSFQKNPLKPQFRVVPSVAVSGSLDAFERGILVFFSFGLEILCVQHFPVTKFPLTPFAKRG